VVTVHFEPWFAAGQPAPIVGGVVDRDRALAGLADALCSLATFVGAREVTLQDATPNRLHAPLSRALARDAPSVRE
jgi:hypothetical protein